MKPPTNGKRGGYREGAGRKPLPPSERTTGVFVRLPPVLLEKARVLGSGNVSLGIREALERASG